MCVVEVDGAGMKETKDFYLKTTIRAASNMAFAGISYNMRDHTEGNYIYFRYSLYSQTFIIRASVIRGPRLSAVFETKI